MFPILLDFGHFPLHTYGFLLALAFLTALWFTARAAGREGIDKAVVYDLGVYIAVSALLGAKLLFLVTEYRYYASHPGEILSLATLRSGGVYYGGFILAAIAGIWMSWRKGLPVWKVADLCAPGIALGQAIGRLGCFSAGCCYGKPASPAWGIVFGDPYSHQVVGVPLEVPLHPAQLYQAAANLALFGLLWLSLSRKRFDGQVFILYLVGYAASRFVIEFFRGDAGRGFVFGGLLSTSQFIGLLLFPAAAVLFLVLRQRHRAASAG